MFRIFAVLLAGCIAGMIALVPYAVDLARLHPATAQSVGDLPAVVFGPTMVFQGTMVSALLIGVGLYLLRPLDLGLPIIERVAGGAKQAVWPILRPALLWGLGLGAAAVLLDLALFAEALPPTLRTASQLPWAERLAAGMLYGGINEEVQLRLFLMPLLVNLAGLLIKRADGAAGDGAYWFGIIGAALVFAAGHLPLLATLGPVDGLLLARTLLLNAVPGLVFGWLFWRRGFEAAMVAHAAMHLVIVPASALLG